MWDDGREDVETNALFRYLRDKQSALFEKARQEQMLICLPQARALQGISINKAFAESHVLKRSPYFQGQFLSHNGKSVKLQDKTLETLDGFADRRTVTILFEELFYNAAYQPFRVLCLDRPLAGRGRVQAETRHEKLLRQPRRWLGEHKRFLQAFDVNEGPLHKLDMAIAEFNTTYIMVEQHVDQCVERYAKFVDTCVDQLLAVNALFANYYRTNDEALLLSVESYAMSQMFDRIMSSLKQFHAEQNRALHAICHKLQRVTLQELGVRAELRFDLAPAVRAWGEIPVHSTMQERCGVLKETVDALTAAAAENGQEAGNRTIAMTTDDLLPCVVMVLIKANVPHTYSELTFLQLFESRLSSNSENSFLIATFNASLNYLMRDELKPVQSNPEPLVPLVVPRRASTVSPVRTSNSSGGGGGSSSGGSATTLSTHPPARRKPTRKSPSPVAALPSGPVVGAAPQHTRGLPPPREPAPLRGYVKPPRQIGGDEDAAGDDDGLGSFLSSLVNADDEVMSSSSSRRRQW